MLFHVLISFAVLFFSSFLASTVLPLTSDGVVIYMIINDYNDMAVVLTAALGSFAGSCITFIASFYGREKIIDRYFKLKLSEAEKTKKSFEKYGAPAFLFSWAPFVGDAIVIVGGLLKIKFSTFIVYNFTGHLIRYVIVAFLARFI